MEIVMSGRAFWTSLFDGFTGEGLFGDLNIPGFPTRVFESAEETPEFKEVFVIRLKTSPAGKEEMVRLRASIQEAIEEAKKGRKVEVALVDASDHSSLRPAAG
ncbi:MAG TPA: hypothetical protein VHX20_04365 [Terracidiphilus sp.]|jgi:hypothetical protein|nr:hypothetical protein [Terracidiphilus sp.]